MRPTIILLVFTFKTITSCGEFDKYGWRSIKNYFDHYAPTDKGCVCRVWPDFWAW